MASRPDPSSGAGWFWDRVDVPPAADGDVPKEQPAGGRKARRTVIRPATLSKPAMPKRSPARPATIPQPLRPARSVETVESKTTEASEESGAAAQLAPVRSLEPVAAGASLRAAEWAWPLVMGALLVAAAGVLAVVGTVQTDVRVVLLGCLVFGLGGLCRYSPGIGRRLRANGSTPHA